MGTDLLLFCTLENYLCKAWWWLFIYLLPSSFNCWAHSLQTSEFIFIKDREKHFDYLFQQVFLFRYFWRWVVSASHLCACVPVDSHTRWALLRLGSSVLSSSVTYIKEKHHSPGRREIWLLERKPSGFACHFTSRKINKVKMCQVSCTVQQPELPETRNQKSFQLIH